MPGDILIQLLRQATESSHLSRQGVSNLTLQPESSSGKENLSTNYYLNQQIYSALCGLSDTLANSYRQIVRDFEDSERTAWTGTAHDIRELLRLILEKLAPTDKVVNMSWYKQEKDNTGPTQKQRVKYILSEINADSKEQEVVQNIDIIEDRIGNLVRKVYGRASDSAHRTKGKTEAFKILRYFEAFAYDLLDLKQ
jgi:hypothetical protein